MMMSRKNWVLVFQVFGMAALGACSTVRTTTVHDGAARVPANFGDYRGDVSREADALIPMADGLAYDAYNFFKGYNNSISSDEQAILFRTEAFSASVKLFAKFAHDTDWYAGGYLRTNMYNAFSYLNQSFLDLSTVIKNAEARYDWRRRWDGLRPQPGRSLSQIDYQLKRIDYVYSRWPSADNPAFLENEGRYVAHPSTTAVYMIQKVGTGQYQKAPFDSIESFFAYHQKVRNGRAIPTAYPWDFKVTTTWEMLKDLPDAPQVLHYEYDIGDVIITADSRDFKKPVGGALIIEMQDGKKVGRGVGMEEISSRYHCAPEKCWNIIFRVPSEVFEKYAH